MCLLPGVLILCLGKPLLGQDNTIKKFASLAKAHLQRAEHFGSCSKWLARVNMAIVVAESRRQFGER
jgi:hypothetical protein